MRFFRFKSGALGTWLARVARRYGGPFLIGTVVCIACLLLYVLTYMVPSTETTFKLIKDIEARTLDVRFRVRGPKKPDPAIVIVAIDEKSEDVLGRWPFPRTVFADTLDFMHDAKARVVAFDINFPEPDQNSALETLQELKKVYHATGNTTDPKFLAELDKRNWRRTPTSTWPMRFRDLGMRSSVTTSSSIRRRRRVRRKKSSAVS